jgi:hypothetical protein
MNLDLNYSTGGDRGTGVFARYERYRLWCQRVLGVYPASFEIWRQIEGWLIQRGRFAVLDDLCFDRRRLAKNAAASNRSIVEEDCVLV